MPYQTLSLEYRPPLAVVALTRPESGNRVDLPLIGELREVVAQIADDGITRAAILTGSDGVFSLGWERDFLASMMADSAHARANGLLGHTFQFLAEGPLPIIAAINGAALSAGFELALACDLRLAATTARVGLPETTDGLVPMAGGTQRLARLAGRGTALAMILTGESIDASEAARRGIVSEAVEPAALMEAALHRAETIASRGPIAVRFAKEAVYRGLDMPLDQALRFETDLTVLLQTTADRAEGVQAFKEKREPHFGGH